MAYKRKSNRKYEYTSNVYDVEQRPWESEIDYYYRLARVADARMRAIEQLRWQKGFHGVNKFAYQTALNDLEIFGGGKRFNRKPPQDRRLFKEKIMAMRHFIESPTSTKRGIIETYQRRVDTMNKNFGTNLTWRDLADFFGRQKADQLFANVGSRTAMRAIGVIQYSESTLAHMVQNNRSITLPDEIEIDTALDIIRNHADTLPDSISMDRDELTQIEARLIAMRNLL